MSPKVLIGVPSYSGADDLLPWCLEAIRLRSCTTIDYTLVVIDDSGRNEHRIKSQAVANKYGARWTYNDVNKGITSSWNTLSCSGNEPLIVLLNDDIIVSAGWLESIVYFLENNPQAGCVGLGFNFINKSDVKNL